MVEHICQTTTGRMQINAFQIRVILYVITYNVMHVYCIMSEKEMSRE